ncbi:hypothetical protein I4U23_014302 [Adineta vaga]|nr:hypothetical protein I4U23_014302 [Adineta vaga]
MNLSTTTNSSLIDMNRYFICRNGEQISWTSVCDGFFQCLDGSDEQNCHCQGDIYACLQGNNVSCKIACATYGRVTCLTYQNLRACEHYTRKQTTTMYLKENSTKESLIYINDFDAFRYSVYFAIGTLLFIAILSLLFYCVRKKPSQLVSFCMNKLFNSNFNHKSTTRLSSALQQQQLQSLSSSSNLPRSRYTPAPVIHDSTPAYPYIQEYSISSNDCYEPPLYPRQCLFSSINYSDSIYYETIKTPSSSNSMAMLQPLTLPEPQDFIHLRTHCV